MGVRWWQLCVERRPVWRRAIPFQKPGQTSLGPESLGWVFSGLGFESCGCLSPPRPPIAFHAACGCLAAVAHQLKPTP